MKSNVVAENADFYFNILRQLPGLIVVSDKQSRFIYSNQYTAELFGYISENNILGLNAYDLKCQAAESAPEMIQQDQMVIQTGNELTILDIHTYAFGEPKILLTKKTPYRVNGVIMGSICHCTEMHSITLSQTCAALIQSDQMYYGGNKTNERSYTVGKNIHKNKLSERELDCIFYLLRGYTMKEIAKSLAISPRTVETHLETIKVKLNCSSRSQIIEDCLCAGLLNYIPAKFMSKNISSIIYQS